MIAQPSLPGMAEPEADKRLCSCGHMALSHFVPSEDGEARGCAVSGCACERFAEVPA